MAQLFTLGILWFAIYFSTCQGSVDSNFLKFDELAQFVLKAFNAKPNSVYLYKSAQVIDGFQLSESDTFYHLQVDFSVGCNSKFISDSECFPKNLICDVTISENPFNGERKLVDDNTQCNLPPQKEQNEESPTENTSPVSMEKQKEDLKAMFDGLGPFLLKHLEPISEEIVAPVNADSVDADDRMIRADETPLEEPVVLEPVVEVPIIKKKVYCTGCLTDINTDLPALQGFAEQALAMIDQSTNNLYKHNIVRIAKAQKQVVSGVKYILTLEVSETYCLKTSGQERDTCESSNGDSRLCVVEFLEKPWLNSREIISNNCTGDKNDLENEIEPHFAHKPESDRQSIFDYLDSMDGPMIDDGESPSYKTEFEPEAEVVAQVTEVENNRRFVLPDNDKSSESSDEEERLGEAVIDAVQMKKADNDKSSESSVKEERLRAAVIDAVQMKKADNEESSESSDEEERLSAAVIDAVQMKKADNEKSSESSDEEERLSAAVIDAVQMKKERDSSEETSEDSDEVNPLVTSDFVGGVYRKKREVLGGNRFGGLKEISESEKKLVHDLAELAVHTLDEIDADDSRRIVLEILDAKKQLVDGVMYHLKIRVGTTSCSENGAAKRGCLEDQIATPKICTIQMHRSFASDSPNDVKVVKSECTNESAGRRRRTGRGVPGGFSPANISDPYIQEMASFAVAEFDKMSNSLFKQSLVRVVEAKQQVVAGMNIHLTLELGESNCRKDGAHSEPCVKGDNNAETQICHVTIWDQPWLKNRQVTNMTCGVSSTRTKRSPAIKVGGATPMDLDDPKVESLAKLSLIHLDGKSNALYAQKVKKVLHATRQVVGGMKYSITVLTGYTTCRKGGDVDVKACDIDSGSNEQVCTVEIWERAWQKTAKVVSSSCAAAPQQVGATMVKRSTIGGGSHDIHLGIFREFMTKHKKVYGTQAEMKRRFHIFRANMKKVQTLQQTEQGTGKYGATRFADLTSKEFKKLYLGLNPMLKKSDSVELPHAEIPQITLPPEYDWRNYNVVTPVKNQGMCGSCWAFSVTGNVEGQWALRRGELLSLSEQELVDCDKLDDGCNGGLPENAYKAITTIGGLETEKDYPYDGADETCHFNKTEAKVTVTGGLNITTNETQMAQWLVKNGPISIGINANAMQFYFGGVSHPWKMLCDPGNLDHGVLIVGYGVHNYPLFKKTLPFWIVKNSWGEKWGEQGYYRVYRGDGTCGVNQMATSAVVG